MVVDTKAALVQELEEIQLALDFQEVELLIKAVLVQATNQELALAHHTKAVQVELVHLTKALATLLHPDLQAPLEELKLAQPLLTNRPLLSELELEQPMELLPNKEEPLEPLEQPAQLVQLVQLAPLAQAAPHKEGLQDMVDPITHRTEALEINEA